MSQKTSREQVVVALGVLATTLACLTSSDAQTDEQNLQAPANSLAQAYQAEIRPLLATYCHRCHAGDRTEADIDLAAFPTLTDVRKDPRTWQKVREMLMGAQMPPPKSKQPRDEERTRLRKWVREHLRIEAEAQAGDPGRVVLRRLTNAEYTYTVRDLTRVDTLDPTHEFPVDGAAGEGFANTGDALVMSPSLVTKYLGAAKRIASHAVLLPDGIRFSRHTTRRDWTDELLGRIRVFYREFTDHGGDSLDDMNDDARRLPVERYLKATLTGRNALTTGQKTVEALAHEHDLNARYLGILWTTLTADTAETTETATPSTLLLDRVRERWRSAKAGDVEALAAEIERWQKALWKFNTIGHIGREGGPASWQEAVHPIATGQDFKLKLSPPADGKDTVVYLVANDAGDGNAADYVVWKNPRLEVDGRNSVQLRDAAGLDQRLAERRQATLSSTASYLAAVAEAVGNTANTDAPALATRHGVEVAILQAWLSYLDLGEIRPAEVKGHFTRQLQKVGNHDFVSGWGTQETPFVVANSSDEEVRIPGLSRPHSVLGHPSPTLFAAVGWHSPMSGEVQVEARLVDGHPECGNGVEWVLEHRSGPRLHRLWQGHIGYAGAANLPAKTVQVQKGALLSFILGPRGGHHGCDLTEFNLVITEVDGARRVWDLATDVSGNILEGNPHADRHGNEATWHFYKGETARLVEVESDAVPEGSLLASWQAERDPDKRRELAARVQALAIGEPPVDQSSPDATLYRQLQKLGTPTDHAALLADIEPDVRFGKHPLGHAVDPVDLVIQAPAVVQFRVPTELARIEGLELVVRGELEAEHGSEGSVQLQVLLAEPDSTDVSPTLTFVVRDGSEARRRVESAFDAFRQLFPAALCYPRIVPVDEVVTLTLFYREDEILRRLMLDDEQAARLDRLWDELRFVSHEPLELVTAFEQLSEFATQDRPKLVIALEPLREPINDRADAFRERLISLEPTQLRAVLEIADRAWRRTLTERESDGLRDLYDELRVSAIPHDEAIRLTLARVLTSPSFLYRLERPGPGATAVPISNAELSSRLSYFLWSSMPDAELRQLADAGKLTDTRTLVARARRMLTDHRTRRLAIEFACQWLHIRDFDQNADKNEKLYPEFADLRDDMYEESVRFFADIFRSDGSILGMLNADHTFLNESLARHYDIDGVSGDGWQRVNGVRAQRRGGVLAMATVLAKQSGASRTSPILRGNWVFETLLGERLPRPPATVPQLPEAVPRGLTARELIERHSSAPECAKCHVRIDPYGFALEQYDAIGRLRPGAVDTRTKLLGGTTIEGIEGLREYLLTVRRDDFLQQFCRKLLGYALGRAVQLADEPLLEAMQRQLEANGYRFSVAVEAIVTSPQFREIRGKETAQE